MTIVSTDVRGTWLAGVSSGFMELNAGNMKVIVFTLMLSAQGRVQANDKTSKQWKKSLDVELSGLGLSSSLIKRNFNFESKLQGDGKGFVASVFEAAKSGDYAATLAALNKAKLSSVTLLLAHAKKYSKGGASAVKNDNDKIVTYLKPFELTPAKTMQALVGLGIYASLIAWSLTPQGKAAALKEAARCKVAAPKVKKAKKAKKA